MRRLLVVDEETGEIIKKYRVNGGQNRRMTGHFIKIYDRSFSILSELSAKATKAFICLLPYVTGDNSLQIQNRRFTAKDLEAVTKLSKVTVQAAYAELKEKNIIRAAHGNLYINPNFVFRNLVFNSKTADLFEEGNE